MSKARPNPSPAVGVMPLYNRHAGEIYAFFRVSVAATQQAEDLAQEVWLRVHRHLGAERSIDGNPRAWLFKIARNVLADWRRGPDRKQQVQSLDHIETASTDGTPLDAVLASEYAQKVQDCLGRLPPRERELLAGRSEGHKPGELAHRIGLNVEQVSRLLYNARQKMSDCLGLNREEP